MKQIILVPIYYFFKYLVRIVLKIYHPRTHVLGQANLQQKGPLIVISNHPNTLLDPLHVAIRLPRYVHFLANASLFKNPILGWILNQLYCIPVQRTQDTDGKPLDNKEAFSRSNDFLSKGGCLYVAPEGTSWMEKRLHPLKTGTARIALSFEAEHDFKAGLQILPIGLIYDQPNLFGSRVQISVGTPVEVSKYQSSYASKPQETVRQLTDDLETILQNLIIHTETLENESLFNEIQDLYYFSANVDYPTQVRHAQDIARTLLQLIQADGEAIKQLRHSIAKLQFILQKHQLSLKTYQNLSFPLLTPLSIFFSFPLFLVGLVFNWFVGALPMLLRKWMKPVIEYHSTFNVLGGLIAVILIYPFNIYVMESLLGVSFNGLQWWGVILSMLFTGIFAKNWELQLRKYLLHRRWLNFRKTYPGEATEVTALASKILEVFE